MDAVSLARKLGSLRIEHRRRLKGGASQEDLLPTARAVAAEARRLGVPDLIAAAALRHGEILVAAGRFAEAARVLSDGREVLGDLRQHDLAVVVLSALAEAHGRMSDWERTSALCEEGIGLVEAYRYRVSAPYMQSGYLRSRIGLYQWGVRSAFELGDHATMLERAELSKGRGTLRLHGREGSPEGGTGVADLEERFRAVCLEIDAAGATVPNALRAERQALWDLLAIQRHEGSGGADLPTFRLTDVQGALGEDEAVLYYYWLERHALLIVTLDRTAVDARVVTFPEERRAALEDDAAWILAFQRQTPRRLDRIAKAWTDLLPPPERLEGKRRLLVSPHQILHPLPFHALRRGGRPLLDTCAVTYVPNLTSLLVRYTPAPERRVLALGIDDFELEGRSVTPLDFAEEDARTVAGLYEEAGAEVVTLVGEEAKEARLRELQNEGALERFSCLHLTTHGENVPSDAPMESFLYLRDSVLDGLEISRWRIRADLVVLSACCSGQRPFGGRGMDVLPGDEMFGLQAAFFSAGTHRLLTALWPVEGSAARPIVAAFHQNLLRGDPPEVALQSAQKGFLAEAGILSRTTYYWAPFVLSAMGRPEP